MKAIQATRFGGPEVLEVTEVPDPIAGQGELVVGVSVASILMLDVQLRAGAGRNWFPAEPPYVPRTGVAGEVISVGEGVDSGWIGRRVAAWRAAPGEGGGYAERFVVPEEQVVPVPDGLGLPEAAALLQDGRTALALADYMRIEQGEGVLITAAGGGMGLLLVQLAHAAGARVIGAARGEKKLSLIRELGADAVVDYSELDWTDQVLQATGGAGPDVVLDGVGGKIGLGAFEVTAQGGRFSAHGAPSGAFVQIDPEEAQRRGITVSGIREMQFSPVDGKHLTQRAFSEAVAGKLRPIIGQTFTLERATKAHAAIEARKVTGKTLLIVRPSSPFTRNELDYLESQTLGRLATAQPNGTLQVSPVGFKYNPETATIDIRGYNMAASRKFRNVADNGRVAFVVDDIASRKPWRVRCLEIRGHAEAIEIPDMTIIRVHPERIIGFGIDGPDKEPHKLTPNSREATEPPDRIARKRKSQETLGRQSV